MKIYHDKRTVYTNLSNPQVKPSERASYQQALSLLAETKDLFLSSVREDDQELDLDKTPGEILMGSKGQSIVIEGYESDKRVESGRLPCSSASFRSRRDENNSLNVHYSQIDHRSLYTVSTTSPESYLTENIVYNSKNDRLAYVAEETFRHPKDV